MLNPYHLAVVTQGVDAWNQWRNDSQISSPELAGADLSEFDLTGYVLSGANLSEANLCRANLSDTNLTEANLSMAYLIETNLFRANLSQSTLTRANLAKANLFGVDLTGADLSGVNLSGANLTMADLTGANLEKANLSLATLIKAHLKRTSGVLQRDDGIETSSSGAILTPVIVSHKDLIPRDKLIGINSVNKSDPVQVNISIFDQIDYYCERTLTTTIMDLMKAFGFNTIGNPKVAGDSCSVTFMCEGTKYRTSEKVKEALESLCDGLSRTLKKEGLPPGLTGKPS